LKVEKPLSLKLPHRDIAILLDEKTILLEDGTEWPYEKTPVGTKIYASKKLIKEIWFQKKLGEVLKYDGDIIKWRIKCPDRFKSRISWPNNEQEVTVVNSRSFPPDIEKQLDAYIEWRDWVESYGGNIVGTMSSTSWSLFKTTLSTGTWETPYIGVPGIDHPIGGRVLPCKSTWTSFKGDFIQWDLYSAYSRKLAGLAFGGTGSKWKQISIRANFDQLVENGFCVYIKARLYLRKSILGPVPIRRPRYSPRPTRDIQYPTKGVIEGIWTYEEIRAAERAGAKVIYIQSYIHIPTGRRYFHRDWFKIIQEGRENLTGYSKGLAKQTGNALWGRYAMRIRPAKTVWRNEDGEREWIKHPTRMFKRNQCMELADQLCGKIRSSLYEFASSADDLLLQGNTDGAWISNNREWRPPSDDWRIKRTATRIDIIDDVTYRYWTEGKKSPTYIVPGINIEFTENYFDRTWEAHFA